MLTLNQRWCNVDSVTWRYINISALIQRYFNQLCPLGTEERPFQCSHCDKSFNRNALLIMHEMNHTGYRPFQCCHCNMSFKQKCHLIVHQRIHSGEHSFQCSHSSKNFAYKEHSMEMSTSGWFLKSYITTMKPWLMLQLHRKVFKKYIKMHIFSYLQPLMEALVCGIFSKRLSQVFDSPLKCDFLSYF